MDVDAAGEAANKRPREREASPTREEGLPTEGNSASEGPLRERSDAEGRGRSRDLDASPKKRRRSDGEDSRAGEDFDDEHYGRDYKRRAHSRERDDRAGQPRGSSREERWETPSDYSHQHHRHHHYRDDRGRGAERGWEEPGRSRSRPLPHHSSPPPRGWPDHQRGASPPPRGGEERPAGRRPLGSQHQHPQHYPYDDHEPSPWPPYEYGRERDHRRGPHYSGPPRGRSYDRRDDPSHYPPALPLQQRMPAYRDGRDAFGRDWPPPGRGGPPAYHGGHEYHHDYRPAGPGLLSPDDDPHHRPRHRPRLSHPPSDRGDEWARGHRERGWSASRDDPSRNDRRKLSEAELFALPLKAYSQWLELQDDQAVPTHEATRQYEEYKSAYMRNLALGFFNAHKDDAWFQDKYDPEKLDKKHQAVTAVAQQNYAAFVADHEEGKLDWNVVDQSSDLGPTREEEEEAAEEGRVAGDEAPKTAEEGYEIVLDHLLDAKQLNPAIQREVEPPRDPNSLCVKYIPVQATREELLALFEQVEGFVELVMSEPKRFHNFHRTGWAVFENADACRRALHKFNGYQLRDYDLQLGLPHHSGAERRRRRVRVAPPAAAEEARVKKDAETAAQLVRILDQERSTDSSALFPASSPASTPTHAGQQLEEEKDKDDDDAAGPRTRLNRYIEYLRRVHLFCYYCGEQFESDAELRRMCGDVPHRRSQLPPAHESSPEEVSWLAYLDARLEQRLSAPSPGTYTGKAPVEQEVLDPFLEPHIKREDEKKYRCGAPKCTKLFMAPDFVRKHLKLKHQQLVDEATHQAVYFQNYLRDPRRILPSMPEATLSARPEQQPVGRRGGSTAGGSMALAGASPSPEGGVGVMGEKPPGMAPALLPSPSSSSPLYGARGMGSGPPSSAYAPYRHGPPPFRPRGFGGGGRGGSGGGGGGRHFGGHHRPGYVDLDAPPEDVSAGEQRTTIDYGDLDAVPEPPPSVTSSSSSSS